MNQFEQHQSLAYFLLEYIALAKRNVCFHYIDILNIGTNNSLLIEKELPGSISDSSTTRKMLDFYLGRKKRDH